MFISVRLRPSRLQKFMSLPFRSSLVCRCFSSLEKQPLRILSGIQPTGQIHLGNYFGAIKQWVKFQDEKCQGKYQETIYSIVDLHAITLLQDRDKLQTAIFEAVATIIACGVDPQKSVLFLQSHVPLHCQLSWVLGCLTTMPRLGQLPQFKEKSKSLKEIPLGLYTYPVLQAADVLLYNASHVPVGEDNIQQIQFAQHTAQRFNRIYGETFVTPKSIVESGMSCRIRSLRKPENKMSKSEPDARSRIGIMDSPEDILEKMKKAVTDFTSEVTYDQENRPGVSNLIQMHSLCTGESVETICANASGIDTGKYKLRAADALVEYFRPMRNTYLDLMNSPSYLIDLLKVGAEKATSLGMPMWENVCNKVGISPQHSFFSVKTNEQKIKSSN